MNSVVQNREFKRRNGGMKLIENNRGVRLYSVAEVQRALAIGRTQAYSLVATGQLPAVRIGRSLRICEEDLKVFVDKNRQ